MKRIAFRLTAMVSLLVLLISLTGAFPLSAESNEVKQKRNQLQSLQQQQKEIQSKLDALGDSIDDQKVKVNQLNKKVTNLESQIDAYREQIAALDKEISGAEVRIAALNTQIDAKEKELAEILTKLKRRAKAITKTGNYSSMQLLFSTESYEDYLLKTKVLACISEHDQSLREQAIADKQLIEKNRTEVEAEKAETEAQKAELNSSKSVLDAQYSELDKVYESAVSAKEKLERSQGTYEKKLAAIRKSEAELDAEIEALLNGTPTSSKYGGKMYWPAPGVNGISCTFGQKKTYFHGGTDIWGSGCLGRTVVAAADGTVIKAVSNHYSYGNFVMIDHGMDGSGRRIVTLYAHMRYAPSVKVGQTVVGGKTKLGVIGSTGNSTGPHLHFEVREDNKRVDPVGKGYIVKP